MGLTIYWTSSILTCVHLSWVTLMEACGEVKDNWQVKELVQGPGHVLGCQSMFWGTRARPQHPLQDLGQWTDTEVRVSHHGEAAWLLTVSRLTHFWNARIPLNYQPHDSAVPKWRHMERAPTYSPGDTACRARPTQEPLAGWQKCLMLYSAPSILPNILLHFHGNHWKEKERVLFARGCL